MERLIVICVSLFLTFYASPIIFFTIGISIEKLTDQGIFQVFLTLIPTVISIILFFMAVMKLGEKLIIKQDKKD